MPVKHVVTSLQTFLNDFLPPNAGLPSGRRNAFHDGFCDAETMCASFNAWCNDMQLPYILTAPNSRDSSDSTLSVLERSLAMDARVSSLRISVAQLAWYQAVTLIEYCDARDDQSDSDELETRQPQNASEASSRQLESLLKRQETHVLRLFKYQHRRYVQTAIVQGTRVRFCHWDRSGTVVSEGFDYVEGPEPLFTFFYVLLSGGRPAQGYDCSVNLAAPHHIVKLGEYQPKEGTTEQAKTELLLAKQEILGGTETERSLYPVHCITCPDVQYRTPTALDCERTYAYLIGRPRSAASSLIGRGTRAYAAYDVDHDELVFLKDCWCGIASGLPHELDVYKSLFAHNVRFVATALAGGAVEAQSTMTHGFMPKTQLCFEVEERRHYRVVLKQIGRPLWWFRDSRELVSAVNDALIGHHDAYEKARILHRDISADNIVIDIVTGRGVLVDWDHSVSRDDDSLSGRTGTWTYMSAALLRWPRKPNSLADDLESFYWTLVLAAVRFIIHILSLVRIEDGKNVIDPKAYNAAISAYAGATFHDSQRSKGYMFGGRSKYRELYYEKCHLWRLDYDNGPLATLLRRLHGLLREYYVSLDEDAMEEKYGAPKNFRRPKVASPGRTFGPVSDCLDSHSRFCAIFTEILKDPTWQWTEERTVDQLEYAFPEIYGSTSDSYEASSTLDSEGEERSKRERSPSSEAHHDTKRARVERYSGLFGQEYDPEVFGEPSGPNIGR